MTYSSVSDDSTVGTAGSAETEFGVAGLDDGGWKLLTEDHCRVRLNSKRARRNFICGGMKDLCRRRNHQQIQDSLPRLGAIGYYHVYSTSTSQYEDGDETSWISPSEYEADRMQRLAAVAAMASPAARSQPATTSLFSPALVSFAAVQSPSAQVNTPRSTSGISTGSAVRLTPRPPPGPPPSRVNTVGRSRTSATLSGSTLRSQNTGSVTPAPPPRARTPTGTSHAARTPSTTSVPPLLSEGATTAPSTPDPQAALLGMMQNLMLQQQRQQEASAREAATHRTQMAAILESARQERLRMEQMSMAGSRVSSLASDGSTVDRNALLLEQIRAEREALERSRTAPGPPPSVPAPPASVEVGASDDTPRRSGASQTRRPGFYAVARGRTTGIFLSWEEARRLVHQFSNASHRKFSQRADAEAWLQLEQQALAAEADPREEESIEGDWWERPMEDTPPVRVPTRGSVIPPAIPRGALLGTEPLPERDPSTSAPEHLFDLSIHEEAKLRQLLCPRDSNTATQQDLFESMPDVASLPGKSTEADTMATVASDLARSFGRNAGLMRRDGQWKQRQRVVLGAATSRESLESAITGFRGSKRAAEQLMISNITEVMYHAGYSQIQVDEYIARGGIPTLARRSAAMYYELLLHLQNLATRDGSKEAQELAFHHVKHHGDELVQCRMAAASRSQALLRTYIYLRDQTQDSFHSVRLVSKIMTQDSFHSVRLVSKIITLQNEAFSRRLETAAAAQRPRANAERGNCQHCWSLVHAVPGPCPFAHYSKSKARKAAKKAAVLIQTGQSPADAHAAIMAEMGP